MRLISLELHGFKSFPDKTVLKFAPGVTTVVGPNGSGKSNISDAVRWVLGEISSKNMRGSKMEDVVFGGTDKRKPMQYAEVSLTFDNREEAGFSRLASEYDEVTVTRRYTRNGSSEYKINGQSVRLKDINTLFMNTGIGRDGYSIVSQGKAAEIISQKSDERRNVFEEAAGISKYRYQKQDAERKLEQTVLNCERLADILGEKKSSLDRLEKDAERAKKFLDIYEKKKEADVSLSVYDITRVRTKLNDSNARFETINRALNTADNEINDANAEYENLDIARTRAKGTASDLTSKIEEISESRYSQDTAAQVMKNELEHIKNRISETEEKITSLRDALAVSNSNADKASSVLSDISAKKADAESRHSEILIKLDKIKSETDDIDLQLEKQMEELDRINARSDELRMRLAGLEGSNESGKGRKEELERELSETHRSTETCREGMERYKKRMEDYDKKAAELRTKDEESNAHSERLRHDIEESNAKISAYASDIRDIRTRIDSLRRMEELFEGYPHSVSALMSASRAGKLSGIIGPLSHVFSVNSQYSLAIETALGANIQNIVCETDESAKSAVAWLKQNNAGRSTFYPLNTMQVTPLSINTDELKNRKGYIGVASELVEYEPKFDRVIKNLLGRTLVFDNLDNANATSKAFGYRVRIVTKDGQIVNAGGSITGGAAKRESGVLNRTATIDRLNADRMKIESEKKTEEERNSALAKELDEFTRNSTDNAGKLKLISSLYQADLTQFTAFETQLKTVNETVAKLEEQIKDIDSYTDSIENEKKEIASEQAKLKAQTEQINSEKSAKIALRTKKRIESEELGKIGNEGIIEITSLGKDVEAAQRELETRILECEGCSNDLLRAENSLSSDKEKLETTKRRIENSSNAAEKLSEEIKEMTARRDQAEKLGTELEGRLSVLKKTITEKMSAREVLSNDYTKLEGQLEALNSDVDRMVSYLASEYEMTFSEAEAMNYPPVTQDNRSEVAKTLNELKYKLRGIGSVDPASIEEFKTAKTAYDEMNTQYDDLIKSRDEYANTVETLEKEMRTRFVDVMGEINLAFQRVFREMFGGGNAELVLTDPDDVLHCGIDIKVAPPGKIINNLSLLSGGEQAFISIALFFAILQVNPSPFCIFDEIEAALDEVNVAMFANYMKKYCEKTQFITITHRRGTMEVADTLYGVTMAERGISRVLTLNVSEVESKLGVKL